MHATPTTHAAPIAYIVVGSSLLSEPPPLVCESSLYYISTSTPLVAEAGCSVAVAEAKLDTPAVSAAE